MKLSDLNPHPQNPRKITAGQLHTLKRTLDRYGDLSGIVYNIQTRHLVGAHQRLKILPADSEITYEVRYPTPTKRGTVSEGYVEIDGERYRYREVAWDEDTEKAANLAANKAGGDWHKQGVAEWLLELDAKGWEPEDSGWEMEEFEDLCAPPERKEKEPKKCPQCGTEV